MADVLNILVIPTYDTKTMAVVDISVYDDPSAVTNPVLEISVPGYPNPIYDTGFTIESTNIYNSTDLGITTAGNEQPIPDGVYCFKYMIDPPLEKFIEKSIMRVDRLQEKFDEAFMQLDMMECDRAIKKQSKIDLNTIYFFIQGAIASANNCAVLQAQRLYTQADTMLDNFINTNCGCSGSNYTISFD